MRSIFLVFVFFLGNFCFAQEMPPIQNFTSLEYGAETQNWSITQAPNKFIYVANNHSLLQYDGERWKKYASPNGTVIRAVHANNDAIYIGSFMNFGKWQADAFGSLKYTSLSENLPKPIAADEEIWQIRTVDNSVLFQSQQNIYVYDTLEKEFQIFEIAEGKAHMFLVDNAVYFHIQGQGLFKITIEGAKLVSDASEFKDNDFRGLFKYQNKILGLTEKGKFYSLDEKSNISKWTIDSSILEGKTVYCSTRLKDGNFAIGTISDGAFIISKEGKLIHHINTQNGILNNTVLSIFQDDDENLWLGLDNGISVINLNTPFSEFIDKAGKIGMVYTASNFDNTLYLGTNQGLFFRPMQENLPFKLIPGTEGQVWNLRVVQGTLFCGHNEGTFIINKGNAKRIAAIPGTWDFKSIPNHPNLILQGNFSGLHILENNKGQWQLRNKIEDFSVSSRFFEFLDSQTVVVNHEFNGVFTLQLDENFENVTIQNKQASYGYGTSLVQFNDAIKYVTNNGIFSIDVDATVFPVDSVLTQKVFSLGTPSSIMISDQKNGRIWSFNESGILYAEKNQFNTNTSVTQIETPPFFKNSMGVLGFENINQIEDNTYLIGVSNGYTMLNLNDLTKNKFDISINSVNLDYFNKPSKLVKQNEKGEFESEENSISFEYAVPTFQKFSNVQYQYLLKGAYDEWSSWTDEASKSFSNLPYGNYTFEVRSKINGDVSKNTASYQFEIKKPWYHSVWAYILYVLGALLLGYLIHRAYKSYYKSKQEAINRINKEESKRKKSKAKRKIVQLQNEKLANEISSKNRELAVATMSIIKKNEFLNAIKDQLKASNDNPEIKAVIKTIDRNINNSDDWKFFEDAFNNADKDFLKKIKNAHPELTSNDLKLSAYLRLNLSSKEIAPLLNISVKSVEVKRYRLRKKMQLEHEKGLVDYLMDL